MSIDAITGTAIPSPAEFFYAHAGSSYDPRTETPEQGRARCAERLAQAEREGSDRGFSFEWGIDDIDSSEFEDREDAPHALWECICRDVEGKLIGSLGGVDFGEGGEPWGDPYRRVVEAEIALAALV